MPRRIGKTYHRPHVSPTTKGVKWPGTTHLQGTTEGSHDLIGLITVFLNSQYFTYIYFTLQSRLTKIFSQRERRETDRQRGGLFGEDFYYIVRVLNEELFNANIHS